MSLGLAKDSMLNLAGLVSQREHDDDTSSESKVNSETQLIEEEEKETLLLLLSTHEMQLLQETDRDEESKQEMVTAEDVRRNDKAVSSSRERIEDVDSLRSNAGSELRTEVSESAASDGSNSATSYGNYTGFSTDYSEYDHYGDYAAYGTVDMFEKKEQHPLWCCFLPWVKQPETLDSEDDDSSAMVDESGHESIVDVQEGGRNGPLSRSSFKDDDDDEVSTGSDLLGERLSDKDRQAVLARLRLAQPYTNGTISPTTPETSTTDSPTVMKKGLLNGIVSSNSMDTAGSSRPKSILKRATTISGNNLKDATGNNSLDGKGNARRSLFPSYETATKLKKNLHIDFSPMARVLAVKSHKDMEVKEKSEIWWQRSDYEEFRRTGRMITKAMLEGGSEIWLATNQSWQLPNKDRQSTLSSAVSLAEQHAKFQKGDISAKTKYEETRDKWWHKFGHSRRGLEHIASIDEGRQRQNNVRIALRSVVEEQRRQKLFHREDAEKLRMVFIQHTSWARDLALAAGASDADAVKVNFDDESRKSREFYLLKFSRSNQMKVHTTQKASVPAFMKPALSAPGQTSLLDANTIAQIRYRQTQQQQQANRRRSSATAVSAPAAEKLQDKPDKFKLDEDEKASSSSSMAKQAAGFASGEEIGNMSHVLSGMGVTVIPA